MSSVVADGEVGGDGVAERLNHGAQESEGAEPCGVDVEGGTDFLVDAGQ